MQPYLFPYIGYFQLMNTVDRFFVYDNIQFTKKGWINRNKILVNGRGEYVTVPLKNGSDYADIRERYLADTWCAEQKKLANRVVESYRKAPHFDRIFPAIEKCLFFEETNLFRFLLNSLKIIREVIGIATPITISSELNIDHQVKSEEKVIEICRAIDAETYINPAGGQGLYSVATFKKAGIHLQFLKASDIKYRQFENEFVPSLSIIDVLMFNSIDTIQEMLNKFTRT